MDHSKPVKRRKPVNNKTDKNDGKKDGTSKESSHEEKSGTITVTHVEEEQLNPESETQITVKDKRLEYGDEIKKIILTGGTLQLTKSEKEILYAPLKDSDISIKGDGSLYLTWRWYSDRLTEAFGGTGWVMIPEGMPAASSENKNIIYWGFHLVIRGIYCGFAIGEQQYFVNNRMTYGEACEGAKSNSMVRLGKSIGMGTKLWDKAFCDAWIEKYAVWEWKTNKENKRVKEYRLKTDPTPQKPQGPPLAPQNTEEETPPVTETKRPTGDTGSVQNNPVNQQTTTKKEKKKEDDIPDHELTLLEQYKKKMIKNQDRAELDKIYKQVQTDWNDGKLSDREKEELRALANQRAIELEKNS